MPVEDILNVREISERIMTSGQPTRAQFEDIANAGFEVVINLAMPDSDNAIADEAVVVKQAGMQYVHIPVPFAKPMPDHLDQFFKAMAEYQFQRLWLHCALNYRASAFMYLFYKHVLSTSESDASAVMLDSWQPDAVWKAFMQCDYC